MIRGVLCSISTKGRYHTSLPMAITAVAAQTRVPNKLIIYDDNDQPEDMRLNPLYQNIFSLLDAKGIEWEWVFALKKGQHHNHQMANLSGYEWVWRVDDDTIPESNVLETLLKYAEADPDVGAVAGSVFFPERIFPSNMSSTTIETIDQGHHIQWSRITRVQEVEHLYCSFLYRAGIHDFNTGLSYVAHREETLFTWGLHKKGYKLLVVPNAETWHFRHSMGGGIRSANDSRPYTKEPFDHDDAIFQNYFQFRNNTIVVLDCGMGDHIVFSHVLPEIHNPVVFSCYPEIVPGASIAEAKERFGNIDEWSIYRKMDMWNWTDSLELAFRKLYVTKK